MPTKMKLTILTKLTWTAEYRLKQKTAALTSWKGEALNGI
jgi:hypothetical protein